MENYLDYFVDFNSIMMLCLGVPLGVLLFMGFVLAFIQAVTQIQDQILTFVPKTIMLCILIGLGGAMALDRIALFFVSILTSIRHIS